MSNYPTIQEYFTNYVTATEMADILGEVIKDYSKVANNTTLVNRQEASWRISVLCSLRETLRHQEH